MQFLNDILANGEATGPGTKPAIRHALASLRAHLGMEVAYVSEFVGNASVFREVDAPGLEAIIKPGDSRSLDDVYCRHILAGRLPELIPDTSQNDFCQTLPITTESHIGAHMSVPIRMHDGSIYGMFCCLSFNANRTLNDRDLQMMRVFADMTAQQLSGEREVERSIRAKREAIENALSEGRLSSVFQPIWNFSENRAIGFECLTRFMAEPRRSPDVWFNEAATVGLGLDLETAAINLALSASTALPGDCYLSVNASPELIMSGRLGAIADRYPGRKLIVELTEHAPVDDYTQLLVKLDALRGHGALIAIDDAGAGYAGLQHIVQLRPDMIKLDMGLIRDIDTDSARRALVAALIFFARETGCMIVAEGIETAAELNVLRALGVNMGQGYHFSKPVAIDQAIAMVTQQTARQLAS
jgi:EAL domain-containing protein (putative c-di-GMP-specific phosphodiesterase class I)